MIVTILHYICQHIDYTLRGVSEALARALRSSVPCWGELAATQHLSTRAAE